jgi:hypothetical protein
LALDRDDSAALHRAIDITSPDYERRYPVVAEELTLDRRVIDSRIHFERSIARDRR